MSSRYPFLAGAAGRVADQGRVVDPFGHHWLIANGA